ncbi:formate dehydrogenase accessory sulfurtransferase FdhD [Gleimia hominis]|uniref:Sulfur carrier protein FdhD n=1 Tax=Gleimia hominis TaxID=595468 RepID=A0ABU3I9I3_9ACTO|nr:formate dehydrogenase accessory sulfurtransferase FdhD [Gleimia hominis]MDT3767039.1 formate dehydrogenase accessory sulfurtransferase FdhD [Gleimia hominis]
MAQGARNVRVVRVTPQGVRARRDRVVVEEPLEIRINGQAFATTMRTPGHDYELIHGFLFSEGVISSSDDVLSMQYCAGRTTIRKPEDLIPIANRTAGTRSGIGGDVGGTSNASTLTSKGGIYSESTLASKSGFGGASTESTLASKGSISGTWAQEIGGLAGGTFGAQVSGHNTYNVVNVRLAPHVEWESAARNVAGNSACGVCGSTSIERVLGRRHGVLESVSLDPQVILGLPDALAQQQQLFRRTGGSHGAALFTLSGELLRFREDVGRHNAADKLIGSFVMSNQVPLGETMLVMSSRASFELVQKAVMAGIPAVASLSAATSLAVELATASGVALAGFIRAERFNLYAGELARPVNA